MGLTVKLNKFISKDRQKINVSSFHHQHQSKICQIIANRKWSKVDKFVRSHCCEDDSELYNGHQNETLLHYACRFHPPLSVIQSIVNRFPTWCSRLDSNGQSPLHMAAQYGAEPDIIEYLCVPNRSTSGIQDKLGKTPLHLACISYADHYKKKKTLNSALVLTIKILIRSSPSTVNLEDNYNMNALEYAINAEHGMKVYRIIQKTSEKEYKKKQKIS